MINKILIVDDEPSVLKMLRKMLKDLSEEILEAENGEQALEICQKQNIDLIITDIVMPKKHGIDLIMDVKKSFPNLPIIAISGGGGVTGRFDYLEIADLLGVKNILHKPFESSDLKNIVNNIFGN